MATASASFQSRLGPQLKGHERRVQWVVRGQLLRAGREFRARMVQERLSGPPGVYRKTGELRKSLKYKTHPVGDSFVLRAQIGGGKAYYAVEHENLGRLAFKRIFAEKAREAVDSIRSTMEFFGKDIGVPPGALDRFVPVELPELDAGARAREFANSRSRFNRRTASGRRNLEKLRRPLRRLARRIGVDRIGGTGERF